MRLPYRQVLMAALGTVLIVGTVADALAQRRPDVRTMTCEEARGLIVRDGARVVTTGQHTYDRYLASPGMCLRPHLATGAWVRTRDNPNCLIGYKCAPGD